MSRRELDDEFPATAGIGGWRVIGPPTRQGGQRLGFALERFGQLGLDVDKADRDVHVLAFDIRLGIDSQDLSLHVHQWPPLLPCEMGVEVCIHVEARS
jgi:hypothetical protein